MEFYNKKKRLGDILIDARVINEEQLLAALSAQKQNGLKLGETLIDLGFTTEVEIANALHRQLNYDYVILSELKIDQDIIKLVSEDILRKHTVMPFEFKKGYPNILRVAMANPLDFLAIDDIAIITNFQIEPVVATSQDIAATIDRYYGNIEALKVAQRYTQERDSLIRLEQSPDGPTEEVENAPIVMLVRSIIEQELDKEPVIFTLSP